MTSSSFTLVWKSSASDGGSEIIEYIVEIKETHKTNWTISGKTKGPVTNLVIDKLTKDVAYDFRICARNEAGVSLPLISEGEIVIGQTTSKFNKKFYINFYLFINTNAFAFCLIFIRFKECKEKIARCKF